MVRAIKEKSNTLVCINEVLSTIPDESNNFSKLRLLWLGIRSVEHRLSGQYLPPFNHDRDAEAHGADWTDKISTVAVMVAFFKLKINGLLTETNILATENKTVNVILNL